MINEFNQSLAKKNNVDKDIINLLFINNNHFQLILPKNNKKNEIISNIIKNINLKDLVKKVSKKSNFHINLC